MDEHFTRENVQTNDQFSQFNELDSIPETDPSESDVSQSSEIDNEVTVSATPSESDEGGRSDRVPFTDDIVVYETEPSESESGQGSDNETVINEEDFIPQTSSQSDQENEFENQSNRTSSQNSVRNSESHDSCSNSDIIDATESSESERGQSPENEFLKNSEISIPETPSQSDTEIENDLNVIENEFSQNSNQLSIRNSPAHSDIVSELSNSSNERIASIDDDIIQESEASESDGSQEIGLPIANQVIVSETSSENEEDSVSEHDSFVENEFVHEKTESSESENDQIPVSEFLDNNRMNIPGTSLNSDGEENISVHSENDLLRAQNDSSIRNTPPTTPVLEVVLRNSNFSPDLFDEDDVGNAFALNIAELNTESATELSSNEMNENILNEFPDYDVIPPSPIVNDFSFIMHALPRIDNESEPAIETQSPHESDDDGHDDDDDVTIMHGEDPRIEISAQARAILHRIEVFILRILNDVQNGDRIVIVVQNRRDWSNCFLENERFNLLPITEARCRHIKSTFNLSLIFYVLQEIHEMLSTNRSCTVRELYYKNVNVTQKQENVSEALKTICCILDATPWELGVLSTSKGLIAGPLQIHLPDNVIVDCSIDKNGITLPHLTSGIVDIRTTATHILLVEKDTVFKKLLQNNIIARWNNVCIVMTGKGYPDTNTRLILNKLRELHTLPINVFTDADPYGVEIMLTYRHGSQSMSNLAEALAVPSVRWLGIFPSDIRKFGIAAVSMTAEDQRKLDNILNRPFINDHVHRELLIMKQANLKAEIEGISDSNCTYLIDVYLRNKIDNNDGI